MPRPQFTLRALLVAVLVVAIGFAAWPAVRPPLCLEMRFRYGSGDSHRVRYYGWPNGMVLTVDLKEGEWLPGIWVETADPSLFQN